MNIKKLNKLLSSVAAGKTSIEDAAGKLTHISFEDIDYAHIDHNRSLRKGFPEVIFGQGKSADQIIGIMERMTFQENVVLITRIDKQNADKVVSHFPDSTYHKDARMVIWEKDKMPNQGSGTIAVISAGTSDIPVEM
ncbi:MAG: 1-(5-phosphoribosyl)-5-amino-4-imidazole-carboxylate carboxylase, partial [Thermodesulfobacteriota bacterium]|nr:1-(5-phosphoribosyl)-5-amino-4-imidazole-carboxylate carboxylase [Thermodesulfobacteriota bacterium]